MKNCVNCNMSFRNLFDLNRHMSRKVPCNKEIKLEEIEENPKSTLENPKNTLEDPKSTLLQNKCEYCFHNFFSASNRNKHYSKCKFKDDPIRQMEIELGINTHIPKCETECRFCYKVLSRTSNLNKHLSICKERERYNISLKEKLKKNSKENVINNITNNNNSINNGTINNINNVNINVFGNEDLSHIALERIIDEMRKINKTIEPSEDYLRAGKWVISFNCIVNENADNKNTILSDAKSMVTETLTENGWIKQHTNDAVEQTFKVRSGQLVQMKDQIEDHNPKVFQTSTTQRSWNHLEQFEKHGLNYNSQSAHNRRIKSAFKVSMLDSF